MASIIGDITEPGVVAVAEEPVEGGVEENMDIPNGSDAEWFNGVLANGLLLFSITGGVATLAGSLGGSAGGGANGDG